MAKKFVAKSVKSSRVRRQPVMSQEAWVLVRGYLVPEDEYKNKSRFVGFMRDTKVVALIKQKTKDSQKKRLVFPKYKK